jgi:choline dehydrogenase-like flavoprotein
MSAKAYGGVAHGAADRGGRVGPTDWAFESEPEPGCDGRRIPQPRGKVLGGTSAMNAMVWVRGTRCDYDGWRLAGWGWNDVEPVFRRIESGPMRVTRVAEPDEVSHRFVTAARAIGVAALTPPWRGVKSCSARGHTERRSCCRCPASGRPSICARSGLCPWSTALAPGFIGLADARSPKWLLRWLFRHSGKLTSNLMEAVAHIRSAPGLPAPDFQLIAAPIYVRLDEISHPRPALSILQSYWTPGSRGSVLVSSPDSRDAPAIRLNTLTVADDAAARSSRLNPWRRR